MSRAFLVDRVTGEVSPVEIADDDGVRRYFAPGDDIYGRSLKETPDSGTGIRVWRTRDQERSVEIYSAYDRRTLETVDLPELPAAAKVGLEIGI
jgi:hypothetical protein